MDDDSENQLDCFLPRMSNDDDSNDPFKGLGEIGGSSSGREGPFGNGDETSSEDPLAMASMWHSNSPPTTAGMSTSEPPSAAINPEIMRSYESQQFVDADLIGQRYAEEAEMDERNDTAIDQNQAERRFVRDVEEMHQMDAFQHLDNEGQIEQLVGRKVENSMNLFLTVDTDELEKLDCEQAHSGSLSPTDEGDRQPKEEGEKGKKEYSSSHSRSRDVSMDQSKASTSKRSSATPAPASSIAGSLARVTDFIAQEDQRVLKIHGFGPIHIPCERLEIVLQRDKKDAERRRIKTEREQRLKELDERRKLKDAAREKRRAEKGGVDTDSEQEEIDSKKNKKSKGRKKHGASVGPSGDSVRDEAQSILKRNFNRIVQCCVCELIVSQARFDGRETVYCSQNCIKKKVEQAKKCVKEGERIILIDMKGSIMNSANLTIQNMEAYLHQNPNYQPIINSTQIEEEASQRDIDPTQQKKIDKIRMECSRGIEQALTRRSKEANMNFSIRRYKEMGHDIERALYSLHQDVDVKYRRWFRAFLNVLTDDKNGFFRDVMRDKVSVKKLVTMTSEQMNSLNPGKMGGAMAGTSIVAAADSTSVSETPKVDDPNVLPSSNGGKDEAIVTLGNKIATTSRHTVAKKMAVSNVHAKSAIDDILGTPDTDSTYLHNSHLYDANCKICKMKNQQKFAEKERQEKMEAKLEAKRKAEEAQLGRINFPNLDPTIEAAMHDGGDGGIDDYMPTSSSSASYAAAKRRREELEAEEERRLRDPLGLVDITPVENPPLPPDQLLAAGTAAADDYEDEPMEFSGAADFDDFQDDHHFVEPSAMVQNHTESMDMDIDNDNEEFGNVAFEKAAPKQFNAADREINHQLLRPPPMAHKRPRTPVENQPFVKHHHGAITTTSSLDGIDGEHHQPPPHEGHGENWKRRHAPPVAVPEEEIDPWASTDHQIWKGRFAWNKTIFFDSSLIAISNRGAFKAAKDLPPALHVMGKSEPLGVWQYIGQLKDSWDKQVILLIVEPPTDPTQLQPYGLCYEKINCSSSQQIAVLDLKDHNQIKDGYVFALNPAEPLPKILYPLEGPGLPEWCRHKGCIVVMLIRRMDREDKLWRRRADETWRPRTLQPCGIPLEMVPCPENKLPLLARDPSFDQTRRFEDSTDGGGWRSPECPHPSAGHHPASSLPFKAPKMFAEISPIMPPVAERRGGPKMREEEWNRHVNSPPVMQRPIEQSSQIMTDSPFQTPSMPDRRHSRGHFQNDDNNSPSSFHPPITSTPIASPHSSLYNNQSAQQMQQQRPSSRGTPTDAEMGANEGDGGEGEFGLENVDEGWMPQVETVEDVLDAIQRIDKPANIIILVGNYLHTHLDLTENDKVTISNAVRARSEVERQRKAAAVAAAAQAAMEVGPTEEMAEENNFIAGPTHQPQQQQPLMMQRSESVEKPPEHEESRLSPFSQSASRLEIADESRANSPESAKIGQHGGSPIPFGANIPPNSPGISAKTKSMEKLVDKGTTSNKRMEEDELMRPYSPSDHIHDEHLAHEKIAPEAISTKAPPKPVPPPLPIITPHSRLATSLPMPPTVKKVVSTTVENKETSISLSMRPPPPPPPPPIPRAKEQSPPPPPPPPPEPEPTTTSTIPPPPPPSTTMPMSMDPYAALMSMAAMFSAPPPPPPPPPPSSTTSASSTISSTLPILPPPPPPPKLSAEEQQQRRGADGANGTPTLSAHFPPHLRPPAHFNPLLLGGPPPPYQAGTPRADLLPSFFSPTMPPSASQFRPSRLFPMANQLSTPRPGMMPIPLHQLPPMPMGQQQRVPDFEETLASRIASGRPAPLPAAAPAAVEDTAITNRADQFFMSPAGGGPVDPRRGRRPNEAEMFTDDIELDNFINDPGGPSQFQQWGNHHPPLQQQHGTPNQTHQPRPRFGMGPHSHAGRMPPPFEQHQWQPPNNLFPPPPRMPHRHMMPRQARPQPFSPGIPPRWPRPPRGPPPSTSTTSFGPPPPFAQRYSSGGQEFAGGLGGSEQLTREKPIANARMGNDQQGGGGGAGQQKQPPQTLNEPQRPTASAAPEEGPQEKGPSAAEEEETVEYCSEELEIPAEFGLPTSFFSNKQLWQNEEEERGGGSGFGGGKRGRGGGGRRF